MTAGNQFEVVTAQWILLDKIYRAVVERVETFNLNKSNPQRLTVTARVKHGDEFDVYSQPVGAFAGSRTRVKWITHNQISVSRYIGSNEDRPDSIELLGCETNSDGEKTLRDRKIEEVASQIVEKSK